MKAFITSMLVLLLTSKVLLAQFAPVFTGISSNYFDCHFPSTDTGFIAGGNSFASIAMRTVDGGVTWEGVIENSLTDQIHAIYFPSTLVGYACGFSGFMYKTEDGGDTWMPLTTGTTNTLSGLYFWDEMNGFAVGVNGTILKTTNGGETWVPKPSNTTGYLLSTTFTSTTVGYAAGTGAIILKTSNAGENWDTVHASLEYFLVDLYFKNPLNGFCVGSGGTLLRTSDGGENWEEVASGVTEDLQSVRFYGDLGLIAGDGPTLLQSVDGGDSWEPISAVGTKNYNALALTSKKDFIVGDGGAVYARMSEKSDPLTSLSSEEGLGKLFLFPNPTEDRIFLKNSPNSGALAIEIRNVSGGLIWTRNLRKSPPEGIDVSFLQAGVYLVVIRGNEEILRNWMFKR